MIAERDKDRDNDFHDRGKNRELEKAYFVDAEHQQADAEKSSSTLNHAVTSETLDTEKLVDKLQFSREREDMTGLL